jgi:outer membrane protein
MSFRALGATLVVAIAVGAAPALGDTFTLNEAMGIAYETNPTLEAQRANLRASDEQVAQANAGWRPTINAAGNYSVQRAAFTPQVVTLPSGTTVTISDLAAHPVQGQLIVNQPLFRGGRTYAEIQRAKAIVHAGRAQLLAQEQTTLLNVVTAYMNVVRDTAIVGLRHRNVDVLTKQRNATKAEFDAGSLTKTDLAQSEARLAGAEADLITAQGQLDISRASFEDVVGRPAETLEEDPAVPKLPDSVEPVLTLAAKDNPSLLQAQANEHAADYAVDDALGALAPTLSVQGQYQYSGGALGSGFGTVGTGQVDHITSIVGQLTVPIYQGGAEEASVRQAKELHNQSKLNVDAAGRQVQDAVRSAWAVFVSFNATISSNQLQVNANQSAATGVQREQQVGGRTILDVLNAEQELLNAQVALVTARRNTVVAAYAVLASEGHLTAGDLGLKVKVYDPRVHYDEDHAKWFGLD